MKTKMRFVLGFLCLAFVSSVWASSDLRKAISIEFDNDGNGLATLTDVRLQGADWAIVPSYTVAPHQATMIHATPVYGLGDGIGAFTYQGEDASCAVTFDMTTGEVDLEVSGSGDCEKVVFNEDTDDSIKVIIHADI